MIRKVEVVPHNPNWHSNFEHEAKQVMVALGDNVVAIHHIGSTSIPAIHARSGEPHREICDRNLTIRLHTDRIKMVG